MKIPQIKGPKSHDFHDSRIIKMDISDRLDTINIILKTPNIKNQYDNWKLIFSDVLRFEYETRGSGIKQHEPIEIYDVYNKDNSDEFYRWHDRLKQIEVEDQKLYHIILASSLYAGWGKNDNLYGLSIICRRVSVEQYS